MKITSRAVVSDVYHSEKTGRNYYTFSDVECGGTFTLSLDGELDGVKLGQLVVIDGEFKPRVVRGGGNVLEYLRGSFGKGKVE